MEERLAQRPSPRLVRRLESNYGDRWGTIIQQAMTPEDQRRLAFELVREKNLLLEADRAEQERATLEAMFTGSGILFEKWGNPEAEVYKVSIDDQSLPTSSITTGWLSLDPKQAGEYVFDAAELEVNLYMPELPERTPMPYLFAERRNPNGSGKQRLYGFDNGYGLAAEREATAEDWDIRLIWFRGGPGVLNRFRSDGDGKYAYEDITGKHPNFQQPIYGATIARLNQTAEMVEGWVAPEGLFEWEDQDQSKKKRGERDPEDRSGAVDSQDTQKINDLPGEVLPVWEPGIKTDDAPKSWLEALRQMMPGQGRADYGEEQDKTALQALRERMDAEKQAQAAVANFIAEAKEEAILDAFEARGTLQAKLQREIAQREVDRRYARANESQTAREAEIADRRRALFWTGMLNQFDPDALRFATGIYVSYAAQLDRPLDEKDAVQQKMFESLSALSPDIQTILGRLAAEYRATRRPFTESEVAAAIEQVERFRDRGAASIPRSSDPLAEIAWSSMLQAETRREMFFNQQGMIGTEESLVADPDTGELQPRKKPKKQEKPKYTEEELLAAIDRALEQGKRDGEYVDPQTGLIFKEAQKQVKERIAERAKKKRTKRQKVDGLHVEEEQPMSMPARRRIQRVEGDE